MLSAMHPMTRVPDAVVWLLNEQEGVISRAQALRHGLTDAGIRHFTASGTWRALSAGIYAAGHPSWLQLAWAGVLIAGPGAALGGAAAVHLLGIADPPGVIDVWCPGKVSSVLRREPYWRFHRGARRSLGSPPRTTAEEAILTLCSQGSLDDIGGWLSKALFKRITTPDRLRRAVVQKPKLRQRALILETLTVVAGGSESPMEVRFKRDVEKAHGLPSPSRQKCYSRGRKSDLGYTEYGLIAELDGMIGHRGAGEIRDARRDAEHLVAGLAILRFGWSDVAGHPCETAAIMARVLRARGWRGKPHDCPRCQKGLASD
ncbi:hypothetical protein JS278_02713 [Acidipropionibacterium virtanenii]|uniref:DUF559 domain-containing protein n=2 Tax=Acidipropionibacterium virtanenii TaxID=2057246 RepID=A0A344UX50_9ACTN|nr:hypothetical protein JS278_02713 [Acidipropionibacterium virtanenii]